MIASFFGMLFGTIWTTLKLAAIGGAIGAGSLVIGRLITGASGYFFAACFGAVLIVGVYGSGYLGAAAYARNAALIAQLKIEKASLALELEALGKVRSKEQEQLAEQARIIAENDEAFSKLSAIVAKTGTTPECPGIAAFANELEAINKLQ